MNQVNYFGVIVRLFAIALFVYGIGRLEVVVSYSNSASTIQPSIIFSMLSACLPIFISILIWFFPMMIARKILPDPEETLQPISSTSLLTVFVLAIGVYTFYYALVDAIFWLTYVHAFNRDNYGMVELQLTGDNKANIFITAVEFVVSIVIIAKAKTISSKLFLFSK